VNLRAQPPVRSPLTLGAILAGARALAGGGSPERRRLCDVLTTRFGSAAVALTDSGTTALALALRLAADRRPGRPVLLPAWGCYDLATAADAADVPVAFYDLDPDTLGPRWESLQQALRLEVSAAVGVHFFGVPIDWPRFAALVKAGGAVPIEDAAQGAGGELSGRPLGGLGDLAVLSFGRGKGITGGRGGALLARDAAWQAQVEAVALDAPRGGPGELIALAAQWLLTRPSVYGLPAGLPWLGLGQTVYHPPHPASGLSALAAGVLTITTALAPAEAEARRRNASVLLHRLRGGPGHLVSPPAGARPGWLRLPLRLPDRPSVDLAVDPRARSLGVYPGYPLVLGDLPGFARRLVERETPMPGARTLARELVTLPTHGALKTADLERILTWLGGQMSER